MSESPLLKHARRKLAEQRQQEEQLWRSSVASQKKAVLRYAFRGLALAALLILVALYYMRRM
jgi:type VI protein secretion system component VasF